MPIGWKPLLIAACRVVPLPANGSNTTPPGGTIRDTSHSISANGLTVACWILLPSSRSITGRSFFGAFAWYLNTGKKRLAPPESLYPAISSPGVCQHFHVASCTVAPAVPDLDGFSALVPPLCLSISLAARSSNNTFAGKRPLLSSPPTLVESFVVNHEAESPLLFGAGVLPEPSPTLHASMFN